MLTGYMLRNHFCEKRLTVSVSLFCLIVTTERLLRKGGGREN